MSAEIRVSHAGSLPRTPELIDANREYQSQDRAALAGDNTAANTADLDAVLSASVEDVLRRQKQIGVTEPNDGEYGHAMAAEFDYGAWWHYSFARTSGLELDDGGLWDQPPVTSEPGNIRLTSMTDRRDRRMFAGAYGDPTSGTRSEERRVGIEDETWGGE